jgi:CheY-like chemotaxis protein
VLIVDDEPLILEAAAAMLEDLGCDVVTAANGFEALIS